MGRAVIIVKRWDLLALCVWAHHAQQHWHTLFYPAHTILVLRFACLPGRHQADWRLLCQPCWACVESTPLLSSLHPASSGRNQEDRRHLCQPSRCPAHAARDPGACLMRLMRLMCLMRRCCLRCGPPCRPALGTGRQVQLWDHNRGSRAWPPQPVGPVGRGLLSHPRCRPCQPTNQTQPKSTNLRPLHTQLHVCGHSTSSLPCPATHPPTNRHSFRPPPQILRHVRGHSNVITLLDLFPPSAGIHDFRWAGRACVGCGCVGMRWG